MSCHVIRNPDQPDPAAQDSFVGPPQPDWVALGLMEYGEFEATRASTSSHEWWEDPRRCSCATPEYTNHTNNECYAVATQEDGLCDVCRIWNQSTNKDSMFDTEEVPILTPQKSDEPIVLGRTWRGRESVTSYGELYDLRTYGSEET